MLSLSSNFLPWGWVAVTTHSSSCHALRHFSMKHLSFFPLFNIWNGVFFNISLPLLLNIYLWFWAGFLLLPLFFPFFLPPNKEVLASLSSLVPLQAVLNGSEAIPVHLMMQTLALTVGQSRSPEKGEGLAPLCPPH